MPALLRSRLTLLAAVAALAATLPACGTDEAVERDTRETRNELDKNVGNLDENVSDAAKDAADEVEKAYEDVDGR